MRAFGMILCLAMSGCASTFVRENGKVVFFTQANADELDYTSNNGSHLRVVKINHSTPTRAGGSVLGTVAAGVSGIMAAGAGTALVP